MTDRPRSEPDGPEPSGAHSFEEPPGEEPSSEERSGEEPSGRTTQGIPNAKGEPQEDWAAAQADSGLLSDANRNAYQLRWDAIRARFDDDPQQSMREVDDLLTEVSEQIADRLRSGRQNLMQRWESGEEPTAEELRRTEQRYRDFFERVIAGN